MKKTQNSRPSSAVLKQILLYSSLGVGYLLGLILSMIFDFWGVVFIFWLTFFFALSLIFSGKKKPKETSLTPEQYLSRARKSFQKRELMLAEKNYCQAIYQFYLRGQLAQASLIFEEYFRHFSRVFSPRIQLQLCRHLSQQGKYLLSARALETLIQEWDQVFKVHSPQYLEQALLHLARIYGEKLDLPLLAIERYFQFLERFPNSPWRETAIFQIQLLDQKLSRALKKVA